MYTNDQENFYRFLSLKLSREIRWGFLVGLRVYKNLIKSFLIPSISDLKMQLEIIKKINRFKWVNFYVLIIEFFWVGLIFLPFDKLAIETKNFDFPLYYGIITSFMIFPFVVYFFIQPFVVNKLKKELIKIYELNFDTFKIDTKVNKKIYSEKEIRDWMDFLYNLKKIDSWYEVGIYYLEKDLKNKEKILNNINQLNESTKRKKIKRSFWNKIKAKWQVIFIHNIALIYKQIHDNSTNKITEWKKKEIAFAFALPVFLFCWLIPFFLVTFASAIFQEENVIILFRFFVPQLCVVMLYLSSLFFQLVFYLLRLEKREILNSSLNRWQI
ncbi:hypothetical protein [Mycoplasmopsis pulmonis]|uniref:hypothetical protein n=1 Tax=Mycoplasmopsis pulmonis TaxID=2107 RepID=UPI002ACE1CCF|nr:hypothetical protein [Mycoplasmopsis pulmonis]MDZ7293713.1 hypothetical protein [Mycoplasmopsis pulmonis]